MASIVMMFTPSLMEICYLVQKLLHWDKNMYVMLQFILKTIFYYVASQI